MGPRAEVMALARLMEAQLRRNDGRGGWKACDRVYFMERLHENLSDLGFNLRAGDKEASARTCADLANFVMMLADNEGFLATPAPASVEGNSPEIPDSCPVCKTWTAGGICLPCYESGHDDAQPADHIGDANEMVPAEDSKGECAGCEFEKRYGIKITYLTHTCQKAKGE